MTTYNISIKYLEYEKKVQIFRTTEKYLWDSWGMQFLENRLEQYVIIVNGVREPKTFVFSSTGTDGSKYYFRHDPYLIVIMR